MISLRANDPPAEGRDTLVIALLCQLSINEQRNSALNSVNINKDLCGMCRRVVSVTDRPVIDGHPPGDQLLSHMTPISQTRLPINYLIIEVSMRDYIAPRRRSLVRTTASYAAVTTSVNVNVQKLVNFP